MHYDVKDLNADSFVSLIIQIEYVSLRAANKLLT